jgi:hypothetical protein
VKRFFLLMLALGCESCATRGPTVRPLRPLEIPTAPYVEGGQDSVTGSLVYEGNCLLLRDEDGGRLLQPVWPIGTTFNGTSVLFHRPGKAETRIVIPEQTFFTGTLTDWASVSMAAARPFEVTCGAPPILVSTITPAN